MPSKEKDTVVEMQADDNAACACGTHAHMHRRMIVHAVVAGIALFTLCSVFVFGAIIGKVIGGHGANGRGGCDYQQNESRGRFDSRGPGMMDRGGDYGPGMMRDGGGYGPGMMDRGGQGMMRNGQGYYEELPTPATPPGGATQ